MSNTPVKESGDSGDSPGLQKELDHYDFANRNVCTQLDEKLAFLDQKDAKAGNSHVHKAKYIMSDTGISHILRDNIVDLLDLGNAVHQQANQVLNLPIITHHSNTFLQNAHRQTKETIETANVILDGLRTRSSVNRAKKLMVENLPARVMVPEHFEANVH